MQTLTSNGRHDMHPADGN